MLSLFIGINELPLVGCPRFARNDGFVLTGFMLTK